MVTSTTCWSLTFWLLRILQVLGFLFNKLQQTFKILRTSSFTEHLWWLLLKIILLNTALTIMMAKGNCLWYCLQRAYHQQQIFAVNHLFTDRHEPFSVLLNKIFSFTEMFTLLRKHSSPNYFTWSISFRFILDFNMLWWSERHCQF